MADIGIRSTTVTAVPKDYPVQGTQELALKGVRAVLDGTAAASTYYPALQLLDPNGNVMLTAIAQVGTAAGASVNATWFPGVDEDSTGESQGQFTTETLFLDTRQSSVSSIGVLQTNAAYTVSVQGTMSDWNLALDQGVPEANALFPTSGGAARNSTQVGIDPDTIFAYPSAHPQALGHWTQFEMNLGSGWSHHEPSGGPFTTPQASHVYTYTVVGQGSPIQFRINDSPRTDNYGSYKIVVFSGSTSGPGGGAGTVTSVTSANTAIAVATSTTTPVLTLATLDVIAADGPPAANWSNNSKKITSLATPTLSGDAATKGYVDGIVIPGGASNVQVFAAGAGQSWTKPTGTKVVEVVCIGSGAQGGGGCSGTGAASISGGCGGGGGGVSHAIYQASDVSSPQTVNVAAGGSGAGGPGSPGANGGDGGNTSFGALLVAGGGGGGQGGQSATSKAGGAGGSVSASAVGVTAPTFSASPAVGGQAAKQGTSGGVGVNAEWGGASGGGSTSGGTGKNGMGSIFGGPSGGGGGGATSTTGQSTGAGGTTQSYDGIGGGGGTAGTSGASPTVGGNGTSFVGPFCGAGGGGGGAGNTGVNGKNGGTGGIGAGGGGGGASASGTGGTGGVGGDGRCIVISW